MKPIWNHMINLMVIVALALPWSAFIFGSAEAAVSPFVTCDEITEIPQIECEALVALYNSTNGPGWDDDTNWLVTNTPNDWYGVTVTGGHVTSLFLGANQLSGSIPIEIGNLTGLNFLVLLNNQVSGSIPTEIGNLTSLYALSLSYNQLSGSLPAEIGNLTLLSGLDINDNPGLTGSLPLSLMNLILTRFQFGNTDLCEPSDPAFQAWLSTIHELWRTGVLCDGEFSCVNVTDIPEVECEALAAFYNSTNGPGWYDDTNWLVTLIPGNWYGVAVANGHVVNLSFAQNNLSGSIPAEIGNFPGLYTLSLSGNQLSGSIPAEIGNLSGLVQLMIDNNPGLTGPLPLSMTNLTLETFYFDYTGLCEPADLAFQGWLNSIPDLQRTGVTCNLISVHTVFLPMAFKTP